MGDSTTAREALERGDWGTALELLDAAGDRVDPAEALELRAQAAYGAGELERAVEAWERLFEHERACGDAVAASRAAAMIAMYLMMDTGLMAPVRGWLRTAERLLGEREATPAHALIAMTQAYERFMCGDLEGARTNAALAVELGEATGVRPAVVIGRVAAARVRILEGDLDGGLAQLEEVGALLMSGGADPLTTGMMYCELICAAQGLGMYDMACEWTDVMERWRHGVAFGGINGRCRVHRAEMLRVSGTCDEAEAEALGACDELRPWMRREFGWPLVELGNIRLRRGDLDGAEEAFLEAHQHAWSPQPGLALMHLERGETATAAEMVADAIEHPFEIPSKERPPFGDLRLAPLLDAQSAIAAAQGDQATLRRAAEQLTAIAERYPAPLLRASARLASARAELVAGDTAAAIEAATAAVEIWAGLDAPYETATARMLLGEAYAAAGRAGAARLEWEAAEAALQAFGARRRADEAADLRRRLEAADEGGSPPVDRGMCDEPEVVTFTTEGQTRTIGFQGRTATMRDLKGLRYVARLVAEPGREFHVLDLVASESGVLRPDLAHPDAGNVVRGGEAGLPVLDETARDAYRRRLAEIDDDIEDARRMNDPARAELAEHDREYLVAELRRAVGLGGRTRAVGGDTERARTSVARTIRYALEQLADVAPDVAHHLDRCLRTGTYCCYEGDPMAPLTWRV